MWTEPEWDARVLALTEGRGADHVVDVVGGEGVGRSIGAARVGGTVTLVGFLGQRHGAVRFDAGVRRVVRLQAVSVGSREDLGGAGTRAGDAGRAAGGGPRVSLDEAHAAYAYLASGAQFGKVVIDVP